MIKIKNTKKFVNELQRKSPLHNGMNSYFIKPTISINKENKNRIIKYKKTLKLITYTRSKFNIIFKPKTRHSQFTYNCTGKINYGASGKLLLCIASSSSKRHTCNASS